VLHAKNKDIIMAAETFDKSRVVFQAKLSEQAERYEEMQIFMKKAVLNSKPGEGLNQEERNLLSVAYKNVVGARRASWRVLDSIARREESDAKSSKLVAKYLKKVESELTTICKEVLGLLTDNLLASDSIEPEEAVFYYKMKGDYHRYMAEYSASSGVTEDARQAYDKALENSKKLKATNPIRLGLALNFSVFYYEILDSQKQACELAKDAFDTAVGELEELTEEQYKDATLIMQLLRDNLTLWQSEEEKGQLQEQQNE